MTGSAVQLSGTNPLACKIYAEPATANTATVYVGTSTVTNADGTGVICALAKPGQAAQQSPNHFCLATGGLNKIDTTQFYFAGTSSDKIKVTYYVA